MNHNTPFLRQYVRASKSPWQDSYTILLLANVKSKEDKTLSFERYIYLHKDNVGRTLGISVSKQLLQEFDGQLSSQYLSDKDMYLVLLTYIDEITDFCSLFQSEFEDVFMLKPKAYCSSPEQLDIFYFEIEVR